MTPAASVLRLATRAFMLAVMLLVLLALLIYREHARRLAAERSVAVCYAVFSEMTRQRDICETERSDAVEALYWLKK